MVNKMTLPKAQQNMNIILGIYYMETFCYHCCSFQHWEKMVVNVTMGVAFPKKWVTIMDYKDKVREFPGNPNT